MILAANHLVDISPGADSLGAGLARVIAGSVAAGGLYLLACALVLHLLATRASWARARSPARVAGMGLAVVVVGLGIGYPAGGADLGPIWAFARLAAYLAVGAGVVFLAGRALQARRVHPRR